jgi:Ca2+-transporting ATPase
VVTLPAGVVGLASAEAARRLAAEGPNELPTARRRTLARQVIEIVREPMLLLLVTAGAVNFALAEPLDGLILLLTVGIVVGVSVYQSHKTEHALAALRDLSAPRALVIRDGVPTRIAGREVVRGDVLMLSEGDRVPADAVLVDSVNVSVDESALTGESVPVRKTARPPAGTGTGTGTAMDPAMGPPGGDGTPWVFSGTLVGRGHALGVVARTGTATELGRIGTALRGIVPERTRLQHEIDRLVRVVAVVGLATAVAVVVAYGLTRGGWLEGVLAGIATAMAMLPEEFPVVLTVFLALGAWRLSQRHVLTRRAPVIETLGSASVICVDKTGTLTLNAMTVAELVVDGENHVLDDGPLPERFHELAEFAVLASPVHPFDPMDKAFVAMGATALAGTEHLHREWELVREYPLSEGLLALSHVWRSPDAERYVVAAKGAPEAVADLCHLGDDDRARLHDQVVRATADGQRVLAVARATFQRRTPLPVDHHEFDFTLLGLACLHDPVRPGARAAVTACRGAGVRVVMITGDYPGTALAIARAVGVDDGGGCLTGAEVATLSPGVLAERVRTVSVFARMVPEQKLQLVAALQDGGAVVGMTGDGVNDAPALRAADIGIAMGARGTDVAREAAALVLTDDDISSVVAGIAQGRGILDNLRKAMTYLIAVHVTIVGMAVFPLLVADWPLVLLPVQIALLELVIDPACSVVFEAEQPDPRLMDLPPRPVGAPLFDRRSLLVAAAQGVASLAAVIGVFVWGATSGRDDATVRSLAFTTLVASNLLLILVNRSMRLTVWGAFAERRNAALKWILLLACGLLVVLLSVPGLRAAFGFGPVRWWEAAVSVAAAAAGVTWFEVYKLWQRRTVTAAPA